MCFKKGQINIGSAANGDENQSQWESKSGSHVRSISTHLKQKMVKNDTSTNTNLNLL